MRSINARVMECGQPRLATYMGTYTDGSKHYLEIRYYKRQCRKWIAASKVKIDEGVTLVYCEKVSELGNTPSREVSSLQAEARHGS